MASNPAQGPGGLQGLATRWNDLAKPWRVNVALYALTALSLVALVFELVAGGDTPATVDLASQVPITTTTSTPASTTSRPATTTSTAPTTTTTANLSVTPTTRRPVVITAPPDDTLPDETVPDDTTPDTTTPDTTTPDTTTPDTTTPDTTMPDTTTTTVQASENTTTTSGSS
ncbi:MAG: hypothetical protein QOH36_1404 [Actinomycetota bacterium]|nr:hypothetical protein [Actinomycetota bacterium]